MYTDFFQLRFAPFSIAPDPQYLFMSERHREALAHLLFGVDAGGGIVLLTGEIGAGKTTICRCFLEQAPAHCQVGYIFNPKLTAQELLLTVCEEFRIPLGEAPQSQKELVDALNRHLLASHAGGRNNVLIIDEAQNLSPSVLEQLRLLTNLETNERKLLQIILIGQPELRTMLAAPEMEQLAQRVIARYHLDALNAVETTGYVLHRLAIAGLKGPSPIPPQLGELIFRLSRGVPRRINLLCDRALLGAYALGARQVNRRILLQAAREVFGTVALPRRTRDRLLTGAFALGCCALLVAGAVHMGYLPLPHGGGAPSGSPTTAGRAATGNAASPPAAPAAAEAKAALHEQDKPQTVTPPAAPGMDQPIAAAETQHPDAVAPELLRPEALSAALAAAPAQETQLLGALAALWSGQAEGKTSCDVLLQSNLHCFHGAGGLAELRQLGRPAILTLNDDNGAQRYALLLALDASGAELQLGGSTARISLPALERRLPGRYLTLWRGSPEFRSLLKAGDRGSDVDWIAAHLATVNGDAAPAPGRAYDAALAKAVRAFQSAQGLRPDGVVGPMTVMLINSASGETEPRLRNLAARKDGKE
ncbi:ExeA family protein [Noviherbaspirillum pedocola]|uniref:AAA family ATPase n=1 Tax=Noviherbaspirillum pedocola TaxID=2801341 RepID=A0A934W5I9_9BURK|nr:ExeA family protein [Noviherbaspirillum pedocola]MBK4733273.1 AAA family ATPase [Noviherbaspirillum pedocola]